MAARGTKSAKSTVTRSVRGDLTASQAAKLAKEREAEQAEAAERMSMMTAEIAAEESSQVDDYTGEGLTEEEAAELAEQGITEVVAQSTDRPLPPEEDTSVVEQTRGVTHAVEIVRAREDCQFMLGVGNHYRFSAGRAAKVPIHVAEHMREKGLIW